jgi:hypothetical protein
MRNVRIILVAGIAALATACGGLSDTGGDGSGGGQGIEHPTGADDVVLRWSYEGGFVPVEYELRRLPSWSLFGDGTIVVQGPVIEIYPPPAWPNLLATRISEDGIQAILEEARDAGLTDGDASYDYPCITDMPSTVFTTNAGGTTSVVSAYALGGEDQAGTCPDVDDEARAALAAFQAKLGDLGSWLPEGSIGQEEPFDLQQLRVYVLPYLEQPELEQEPVEWPLAVPLSDFGEPDPGPVEDARCGVVEGADLDALRRVGEGTNEATPWVSDGIEYRLILRALLPDEHGC